MKTLGRPAGRTAGLALIITQIYIYHVSQKSVSSAETRNVSILRQYSESADSNTLCRPLSCSILLQFCLWQMKSPANGNCCPSSLTLSAISVKSKFASGSSSRSLCRRRRRVLLHALFNLSSANSFCFYACLFQ